MTYRAMYKYELAELCEVSRKTFRIWLNDEYYQELKELGYKKQDKLLKPHIVKYLCEKLVIPLND